MAILAPSLLAANFSKLGEEVKNLETANTPWLHLDIMDYCFVPNLTFGAGVVKSLRSQTEMVFDAHLMVMEPEKFVGDFQEAGADYFTFHIEAAEDPSNTIAMIKEYQMKVGISLKPNTPVKVLSPYLADLDLVLVMSVEPGFGGQKFMEAMLEKVQWLKEEREKNNYHYLIEIDGGINRDTAKSAVESGVDVLVAGTAVFKSDHIEEEVKYYTAL